MWKWMAHKDILTANNMREFWEYIIISTKLLFSFSSWKMVFQSQPFYQKIELLDQRNHSSVSKLAADLRGVEWYVCYRPFLLKLFHYHSPISASNSSTTISNKQVTSLEVWRIKILLKAWLFLILNCTPPGMHFTGLLTEMGRKETNLLTIPMATCIWIFVPSVV